MGTLSRQSFKWEHSPAYLWQFMILTQHYHIIFFYSIETILKLFFQLVNLPYALSQCFSSFCCPEMFIGLELVSFMEGLIEQVFYIKFRGWLRCGSSCSWVGVVQMKAVPLLSVKFPGISTRNLFSISNFRHVLNVVCFLPGNSPASLSYMPTFRNAVSVPKRRHIKFRCRGITQNILPINIVVLDEYTHSTLPYFSIDNTHLMYNAHPKLFRHSF